MWPLLIPGRIIWYNTIPAGDYSAFSIEFADYQEVIESCLGLTLSEFITACKEPEARLLCIWSIVNLVNGILLVIILLVVVEYRLLADF